MREFPSELGGARVVAAAVLDGNIRPTGNTVHNVAGETLGPAHALAIATYANQPGFYLFYCDPKWQVLADTWHESVADAKAQAEFEYAGVSRVWIDAVAVPEATIDVGFASSKQSLHEMLAAVLGFPDYYGMNWDAFRDCVLDPEQSSMPHHLIIEHWGVLRERLPADAEHLRDILAEYRTQETDRESNASMK